LKRLRVYLDTSVLGGCFDEEFAEWSTRLIDDIRAGRFAPILSDVTAAEAGDAPAAVQALHDELLVIAGDLLPVTAEALELVGAYQTRGVLSARFRNDMLHIAIAAVAEVDVVVSWNFRHIVNLARIRGYNSVNLRQGYPVLEIRSPLEVFVDEKS